MSAENEILGSENEQWLMVGQEADDPPPHIIGKGLVLIIECILFRNSRSIEHTYSPSVLFMVNLQKRWRI